MLYMLSRPNVPTVWVLFVLLLQQAQGNKVSVKNLQLWETDTQNKVAKLTNVFFVEKNQSVTPSSLNRESCDLYRIKMPENWNDGQKKAVDGLYKNGKNTFLKSVILSFSTNI